MFIFIFITIIRPIKKIVSNSVKIDSQKMGNHLKAWKYDKHVKTAACVICAVTLALPKIFIGLFTLHREEKWKINICLLLNSVGISGTCSMGNFFEKTSSIRGHQAASPNSTFFSF